MSDQEQQAILAIALLAAFADGHKADAEREAIRRMADNLGQEAAGAGLAKLYQDVLLRKLTLADAVAPLKDADQRMLAYEMAVCVCDADGGQTPAETAFLQDLRQRLGIAAASTAAFEREADDLAAAVQTASPAAESPAAALPVAAALGAGAGAAAVLVPASAGASDPARDQALDKTILNYALLNGALELLPQSWASMAIIPLQVKMVYAVGKAHGVSLDQGHIKEFIAAAGVGVTSQYIEQFGRKLLGGLLGKAAGRTIGRIGGAATGMAFSFATTYALGQLSKRYYAGGRVMNTAVLQQTFQELLGPAKRMQSQYLPQIEQTARGLDAGKVMALVRGA
ncbi:MAG: DUF533 domain-containing protein [Hydrogenophaga sp.]|jgi:uncharacterized protein (DUF697 family)/tellurite resistance protein|nr:DUF533 domain-containing protein [Hydrogenophaga sp.]